MPFLPFDSSWSLHGDATVEMEQEGKSVKMQAGPSLDWWKTPVGSEPESDVDRRTGPVYSRVVDGKRWKAGVWLRVHLEERFQQAAIFVHAGEKIGEKDQPWLKAGVELENGKENLGCVVANPYSDWSVAPSPHSVSPSEPDGGAHWLFVEVERRGPDMFLHTALAPASSTPPSQTPSSEQLVLGREVKGFALGHQDAPWRVGFMTCGPLSQSATARFSQLFYEQL